MEHILKTWANTFRFIIILLLLFALISFLVYRLSDSTSFDINYTNDKTMVTIIDKKFVAASSVLPACDCWIDTGIEIRPGESYELKVSGKIHASIEKLIEAAKNNEIPRYSWIGPEGSPFQVYGKQNDSSPSRIRKNLLLRPNSNLGAVLFYFQKENAKKPNCDIANQFIPHPDSVFAYTTEGFKSKNESQIKLHLWASVNDMVIRDMYADSSKIAYNGNADLNQIIANEKKWNTLQKRSYNKIWFDDNFGNFVISAKIEKSTPFLGFW